MATIEVTCMNKGCNNKFRVPEYARPNSTIKNNPDKQECRTCKNKKLMAQSTFNNSGYKSNRRSSNRADRDVNGSKRPKTPRQRAMDNADKWFSRFIRIKYNYRIVNGEVLCRCIVNPNVIRHAKNMDNGHCFSRAFLLTRYEEDNCRPQNTSSNRFSGEADHYKFRDALEKQIGKERFERLDNLRKQEGEDTEEFYKTQADKYRILTNQLVDQLEVNKWW